MNNKKYIRIEYILDGELKMYKTKNNESASVGINAIINSSSGHDLSFKQISIVDETTLKSGKVNQKNLYF